MCGRYYVDSEEKTNEMREIIAEINRRYYGTGGAKGLKTGEIRPTDLAPVLSMEGFRPMRWGFPVAFKSGVMINARAESAAEKPMFRAALASRRLAVPTNGFYEWKHVHKKAAGKYLFRVPEEAVTYLAGLYTQFPAGEGAREERFVILTTSANASVAPYHDRMPLYLNRAEVGAWVSDTKAPLELLTRAQPEWSAVAAEEDGDGQLSLFDT